jgi:hypothetical protein
VTVRGTVATTDMAGVLRGIANRVPPAGLSARDRPTGGCGADCAGRRRVGRTTPLALAHRLSAAVADAIAYRPGVTDAHTTAAEALALGRGVCQDHAHALIALARRAACRRAMSRAICCRHIGRDDPHEAAHAWAEALGRGPGLGRVRPGEPLLPGCALYPAGFRAGCAAMPPRSGALRAVRAPSAGGRRLRCRPAQGQQ